MPPESLFSGEDIGAAPLIAKTDNGTEGEGEIIDRIALSQALGSLPVRARQLIVFRYFQGRTQTQAAELLGISQVQVSRLEKKILGLMKKEMEERING